MRAWASRPVEVANLLNPAFCSLLVRDSVEGFQSVDGSHMPYSLVFLVLPLVLHKPTRTILPRSVATKLHHWIQRRPEVRVGFADRVRWLVPYTKEALMFGARSELVLFDKDGNLQAAKPRSRKPKWASHTEPAECRSKAKFLGRWLAKAGKESTVYAVWGIRP